MTNEKPLCFTCRGERLLGILHTPDEPAQCGVVIVVGGPQYRAGSHRQFVTLARTLSAAGSHVLRYDYRGMGDSDGEYLGFDGGIDEDINAAIDALTKAVPGLKKVVLWGLCDAASGVIFYAHSDSRIDAIAIANPWVRTESSHAKAYIKQQVSRRLFDPAFWMEFIKGKRTLTGTLRSAWAAFGTNMGAGNAHPAGSNERQDDHTDLPRRVAASLERFKGPILLMLSGNDLAAREFIDVLKSSQKWSSLLKQKRVTRFDIKDANHTFSSRAWRNAVADKTQRWLHGLTSSASNQ